jgi:TonB family protein
MRGFFDKLAIVMVAVGVSVGALGAQRTVCDSPCKFILLPLQVPRSSPVPNSNPLAELQDSARARDAIKLRPPFVVERLATPLPGAPTPTYPDSLKKAEVEGSVLASFEVDTLGTVDVATIKILQSTHPLFAIAVLEVLPRIQFSPPELNGIKVRRLVQYPFAFKIKK